MIQGVVWLKSKLLSDFDQFQWIMEIILYNLWRLKNVPLPFFYYPTFESQGCISKRINVNV